MSVYYLLAFISFVSPSIISYLFLITLYVKTPALLLSCEIRNEPTKAEKYMRSAASSAYATGKGAGDYMVSCAKVHCKLRGWEV